MRVAGLDVGTISTDCCRLSEGRAEAHASWDTAALLATPSLLTDFLEGAETLAVAAGYGAPLVALQQADAATLALAHLADPDEREGGIGGFSRLLRVLATLRSPAVLLPGVIHLASVPAYRKLNRIDMGTADKLATAALALTLHGSALDAIVLELGGAFTAALAIESGRIVDGIGGSAGPPGAQASGALDGEVAMLAGTLTKHMIFRGGAADATHLLGADGAHQAWLEGAAKAVHQLAVSAPRARLVLVSGRGGNARVSASLQRLLPAYAVAPLGALPGFTPVKAGAQGAALLADGLLGGHHAPLIAALDLHGARGTVLDHLVLVDPDAVRRRLGIH